MPHPTDGIAESTGSHPQDASPAPRPRRARSRPWRRGALVVALAGALGLTPGAPAAALFVPQQLPNAPGGLVDTVEKLGARPAATRLPIEITDAVQASVDVGTGNLMVSIDGLPLPGVSGASAIGLTGNSLSTERSTSSGLPQRFELTAGAAGALHRVPDGVLYESGDGFTVKFPFVPGSTSQFTSPAGVKADLVRNGTIFTLTSRTTRTVTKFNEDGQVLTVADRNGNTTTYTHGADGVISKVVGSSGPTGARTSTITTDADEVRVSQTSSGQTRTVAFEKDSTNDLEAYVDANGKRTLFSTWSGQIRKITTPEGRVTRFEYDGSERLVKVIRENSGTAADSTTRLAYPTDTQTLVAGPNTDQSQAVSAVPRATYTLNATDRVTAATDPMGRPRSKTYTAHFDTATTTTGTGTTGGTTTNAFGANNGESMTKSTSPTGASVSAEYGNTAAATKYLPTSTTQGADNKSLYTYNGAGNQLTTTDALAAQAVLTYNADGTVATATAPGNGTNATRYTYNANKQLTGITPVTGGTLGAQAFTYDVWGRTATATDGRGNTLTYTYDKAGRTTKEAYSDGTPAVSYAYDADGLMTSRTDATGTTTWTHDDLGRLATRDHSAIGEKITYGYDLASNQTSITDGRGTTDYEYDDSGTLTAVVYDSYRIHGMRERLEIDTDNRGRRTDVWMNTEADNFHWSTHQHTDYDKSGRVARTIAKTRNDATWGSESTVQDKTYCYAAGSSPAGGCPAATTANDRSKIQWVKDAVDGSATVYTYDKAGQLTKAVRTGGAVPRTYTYSYDNRGNRKTAVFSISMNLAFNAANQITTTGYAYDKSGNLTQDPNGTYTYNAAGQMTAATRGTTTYANTYAGGTQAELLTQTTPQGNYQYTYGRTNQFGLPIVEQVSLNGKTAYLENDPTTGQPLMLRTENDERTMYIHDGIGNPEAMVTSGQDAPYNTAYRYDPYGVSALTENSGGQEQQSNPFKFKGGIQDRTTGWVKFGHRWYSPLTGRFNQRDTLDAPLDPANANRYTYAANDPINNADPLGLWVGGAAGAVAGLAVGTVLVGACAAMAAGLLCLTAGGALSSALGTGLGMIWEGNTNEGEFFNAVGGAAAGGAAAGPFGRYIKTQ